YGKALALAEDGLPQAASDTLAQLFAHAKIQDARSQPVFDGARELYVTVQRKLAAQQHSDAFKCVQNYKAEAEKLSGFPVRFEETDFEDMLGATIQMAWKHGRDYHVIKTRRGYDPELLAHLEAHELTHLKLESEARQKGKNLFFATSAQTNTSPQIRQVTPRKIMQASLALNGAYSLFLDNLFAGASTFSALYRRFETFALSQRLFDRWVEQVDKLEPGDEYKLVDEFA